MQRKSEQWLVPPFVLALGNRTHHRIGDSFTVPRRAPDTKDSKYIVLRNPKAASARKGGLVSRPIPRKYLHSRKIYFLAAFFLAAGFFLAAFFAGFLPADFLAAFFAVFLAAFLVAMRLFSL